jgi:hypothetical protein
MIRIRSLTCILLILFLALVGCNVFGGDTATDTTAGDTNTAVNDPGATGILGIDQPLTGQGILVCNSACSDRAQCGYLQDESPVIFVSRNEPRLSGQDAFSPQGTIADILEMQTLTLQNSSTGEQFQASFYRIRTAAIESGWVAGWCIQQ